LLVGVAALSLSGCFLNEIDKSVNNSPMGAEMKKDKEAAEAKTAEGAKTDGKPAKPAAPQGASWWAKATTLSSEESTAKIVGCKKKDGKTDFMTRDDCLARGGQPQ
jgi:hypothetical protein